MLRILAPVVCGAAGIAGVCFAIYIFFTTHLPGVPARSPVVPALVLIPALGLLGLFGYITADD